MIERRDWLIAALVCVTVTIVTTALSTRQGLTRDEAYYMKAGERYVRYYEDALSGRLRDPFSDRAISRFWSYNIEHPPLLKTLYGVSWRVFHRSLTLQSEITAFRLPTAVFFGGLCALGYLFFIEALGSRWGALAAALLTAAQPRAFFHAQTASFDLPVATLWMATTFAYWRALDATDGLPAEARLDFTRAKGWRPAIVTGVLFGLCLATKLQSFLLPIALTLHAAWLMVRGRRDAASSALMSLLMMAIIGPVVMFALWPWLWHDTLARLGNYLRFHLDHVHYNFEYLGRNFNQPPYPWHEPLGMLLFTAPPVLLVLAASGSAMLSRRAPPFGDERSTRALLLLAGVVPIAVFMGGTQPIYGETKHWLATMPFLALAAGYAFDRLRRALAYEMRLGLHSWRATAMSAGLFVVIVVPAAVETLHSHPYGLSHYNALAGGPPGGADLGMNRQFWGYSVKGLLPWLNANLPRGSKLYPHDWNHDAWERYVRDGQLRSDVVETGGVAGSDAAIVIHEKHFNEFDYQIWEEYGHVQPVEVLTLDGVPLVSVYLKTRLDGERQGR